MDKINQIRSKHNYLSCITLNALTALVILWYLVSKRVKSTEYFHTMDSRNNELFDSLKPKNRATTFNDPTWAGFFWEIMGPSSWQTLVPNAKKRPYGTARKGHGRDHPRHHRGTHAGPVLSATLSSTDNVILMGENNMIKILAVCASTV